MEQWVFLIYMALGYWAAGVVFFENKVYTYFSREIYIDNGIERLYLIVSYCLLTLVWTRGAAWRRLIYTKSQKYESPPGDTVGAVWR